MTAYGSMKITGGIILLILLVLNGIKNPKNHQKESVNRKSTINPKENLAFAAQQLRYAVKTNPDSTHFPRTINKDGSMKWVGASDWTSGFFPGELWYMYKYTHTPFWKKEAARWTDQLESQQYNTHTHDVGFMMYPSFGHGYLFTNNDHDKQVVIQSARSLITRFNPKVGEIKSWDNTKWEYPVIIDNMMNLELLFRATQFSGDSTFYHVAVTHALNTIKSHIRPNSSTFHVVDFDTTTGKITWRGTAQGYADNSTWARGESWALYGFTMAYRYTKNRKFLDVAQNVAHYILTNKNLPADDIPYWDYNAPDIPNAPRDASAAAIMSSAFIELSRYVSREESEKYLQTAKRIIHSLSTPKYRAENVGSNGGFILKKSVGNKPANSEISVPLVYADYYYIEANLRYLDLTKK